MKIRVITRHAPSNYGSLLQSIATIKILSDLNIDAAIIDYQRKDERGLRKVCIEAKKKFKNLLLRCIYILIRFPMEYYAQCAFDRMRKRYLTLTQRCETERDLMHIDADIFMTGSDQVWGTVVTGTIDGAYYLDFVTHRPKISYASSFGNTDFDLSATHSIRNMLSCYAAITVREDSAYKYLIDMGLKNCVGQVLDPTFLVSTSIWDNMCSKAKEHDYILLYLIHNHKEHSIYAKKLSRKYNLPLIRVSPMFHQSFSGGRFKFCPELGSFLSLFKNSKYVLTDSFHGTCFSIIFNKQFIELLPNVGTSTRNISLLNLLHLNSRIITDYNDFNTLRDHIDYQQVNDIINLEKEKSIEKLKNIINIAQHENI